MRRMLAVWLPPLAGFGLYYLGMRLDPQYARLRMDEIGEGTVSGFIAYYRFFMPLLLLVGLLTQYLIVLPVWERVQNGSGNRRLVAALILVFICMLFAGVLSYAIWDPDTPRSRLTKLWGIMAGVQLMYWAINLTVLRLLKQKSRRPEDEGVHQ